MQEQLGGNTGSYMRSIHVRFRTAMAMAWRSEWILQRLDYLVKLGVDALWITPFYPSPMADFGYDVADYCGIDPLFGTMRRLDHLLAETHQQRPETHPGLVPNHTSHQHPWFLESRSSRDNPKRDWYLWRDEPNNWQSNFGGSGWEWDDVTGQYYYHSFLKQQPDLNWRNPLVARGDFRRHAILAGTRR